MLKKQRLDILIVEKGLLKSREIAQSAIIQGAVLVNDQKITKPGIKVDTDSAIKFCNWFIQPKYVSRAGYKLEKALQYFKISPENEICLDIGASTGGFTDCLLQHKAQKVYAIDVGYGQIDWKLRQDKRVSVIERTNIRYLKRENLYANEDIASLAAIDLSFISLTKIIEAVLDLLNKNAKIICLIKPQFECSKELIEKGGIIKNPQTHLMTVESVVKKFSCLNLDLLDLTYSPIKGGSGNIEFLAYFNLNENLKVSSDVNSIDIKSIVKRAHEEL